MQGRQAACCQTDLVSRVATKLTSFLIGQFAYSSKSINFLCSKMGKIKLTSEDCCED